MDEAMAHTAACLQAELFCKPAYGNLGLAPEQPRGKLIRNELTPSFCPLEYPPLCPLRGGDCGGYKKTSINLPNLPKLNNGFSGDGV